MLSNLLKAPRKFASDAHDRNILSENPVGWPAFALTSKRSRTRFCIDATYNKSKIENWLCRVKFVSQANVQLVA